MILPACRDGFASNSRGAFYHVMARGNARQDIFGWLFFSAMQVRRTCPDCKAVLGPFQSPFTRTGRQWAEGGYVCRACGCETDLAGAKVPPGKAPSWGWLAVGFGLPALALAVAVFAMGRISPH